MILPKFSKSYSVLVVSLLGYLAFCGLIYLTGTARGWDAPNANVNDGRFARKPARNPSSWYFWQLRPENVTFWTGFAVWVCYILHQLFCWGMIFLVQSLPKQKYSDGVHWYNIVLLGGNFFFHCLHLGQTHLTYDGLAQYTPESSSQGSVIMLLCMVIAMEYRDRGLILGFPKPNQQNFTWYLRLGDNYTYLLRKYHGYAFIWAAVYTFWYHPMESSVGHIFGFFHTSMIMVQGSLIFTDVHLNKYWTVFIETFVTIHGSVVAFQTGGVNLYPMFLFGFLATLSVNQIFDFPFWNKISDFWRAIPVIFYCGVIIFSYTFIKDANGRIFVRIQEVIRIPAILIGFGVLILILGFLLSLIMYGLQKIDNAINNRVYLVFKKMFWAMTVLIVWGLLIYLTALLHHLGVDMNFDLTVGMILLVGGYSFVFMITFVMLGLSFNVKQPMRIPKNAAKRDIIAFCGSDSTYQWIERVVELMGSDAKHVSMGNVVTRYSRIIVEKNEHIEKFLPFGVEIISLDASSFTDNLKSEIIKTKCHVLQFDSDSWNPQYIKLKSYFEKLGFISHITVTLHISEESSIELNLQRYATLIERFGFHIKETQYNVDMNVFSLVLLHENCKTTLNLQKKGPSLVNVMIHGANGIATFVNGTIMYNDTIGKDVEFIERSLPKGIENDIENSLLLFLKNTKADIREKNDDSLVKITDTGLTVSYPAQVQE